MKTLTPNQRASRRDAAERRRCPKCKRGNALGASLTISIDVSPYVAGHVRKCRYCGHERGVRDGVPFGFTPPATTKGAAT